MGSSGDKEFFEQTSDQILANWEQYSGTRLTSSGALLVNKETTEEPECEEDPSETGLGVQGEQEIPTLEEGDDLWIEQLCTVGKYEEEDDKMCLEDDRKDLEDEIEEEDDLWVSQLYTDVDYSLLDTPTSLTSQRVVEEGSSCRVPYIPRGDDSCIPTRANKELE